MTLAQKQNMVPRAVRVRKLQQLLTESRPAQQQGTLRLYHRRDHRGSGVGNSDATNTASNIEDGFILCCYRIFCCPLSLVLVLMMFPALFYTQYQYRATYDTANYYATGTSGNPNNSVNNVKSSTQHENTIIIEPNKDHEISIQQSTISHLKTLPSFPKIIHLIWPDKRILSKDFDILNYGAKMLRQINPDWKFIVHDYDSIDKTIKKFHHPDIPKSMNDDLKHAHIVEKTDAFRLMTIYQTGGLYVDIDRVMNVNLDDVIDVNKVKLVVATYYDINFTNDLFGSAPGNELILEAFRKQCEKREGYPRSRKGWIRSTDQMNLVETYTQSMEIDLFGRRIKYDDETEWDEARHVLNSHTGGMVVTYKDVWCDGLLVNDFEGCREISRGSLYKAYGVVAWDEQVDKVWEEEDKS